MVSSPPRIAPPVPKFSTQFREEREDVDGYGNTSVVVENSKMNRGWPTNEEQATRSTDVPTAHEWQLRTDREEYILYLEQKLKKLAPNDVARSTESGSRSVADSGYYGSTSSAESSTKAKQSPTQYLPDEDGSDHGEDAAYGNLEESMSKAQEEKEEGEALLSVQKAERKLEEYEDKDRYREETASPSEEDQSNVKVVPPTPTREHLTTVALSQGITQTRPTAEELPNLPSRKISFSSSVRISGGIRSKPRTQRHLPDSFSPAPSHHLVGEGKSVSSRPYTDQEQLPPNVKTRSRSGSPGGSGFSINGGGAGVEARRGSSGSLFPATQSGYSSTSGSRLASRSSSPCSSIYAPLQPPSETCPSPLMVRPPPKRGSGMTFREYLRGKEDQDQEEVVQGYRELVEHQRRKKIRSEKKRIAKERKARGEGLGLWDSVKELFSSGAAYSGGWRGGHQGSSSNGLMYGSNGSSSSTSVFQQGQHVVDSNEGDRRPTPPAGLVGDKRSVMRKPSLLSISSVSSIDEEVSAESCSPTRRSSSTPKVLHGSRDSSERTTPSKTVTDVMFGPSPGRWFTLDWWLWKVRINFKKVDDALSLCFRRIKRRSNSPEQEPILQGVYQQV